MIKPLVLLLSSVLSSRMLRKRSRPVVSVLLSACRKLLHRKPTAPNVAADVARHARGGWHGRPCSAIASKSFSNGSIR